jgi:rubrerythrin
MTSGDQTTTGTPDLTYDLVSILYHALQGAEIYEEYVSDAEEAGNQELAQFFREVHQEERQRADRAKQLLTRHLQAA